MLYCAFRGALGDLFLEYILWIIFLSKSCNMKFWGCWGHHCLLLYICNKTLQNFLPINRINLTLKSSSWVLLTRPQISVFWAFGLWKMPERRWILYTWDSVKKWLLHKNNWMSYAADEWKFQNPEGFSSWDGCQVPGWMTSDIHIWKVSLAKMTVLCV